jgi:hypothetical protein
VVVVKLPTIELIVSVVVLKSVSSDVAVVVTVTVPAWLVEAWLAVAVERAVVVEVNVPAIWLPVALVVWVPVALVVA